MGPKYRLAEQNGPQPGALNAGDDAEDDPPGRCQRSRVHAATALLNARSQRAWADHNEKHTPKMRQAPSLQ